MCHFCFFPLTKLKVEDYKKYDYIIDFVVISILLIAVPVVLFFLPMIPQWILLVYCVLMSLLSLITVKCVYRGVILPHMDTIIAAQKTRMQIIDNKKRIRKIERNIHKDKNEDMYGLEEFDSNINTLHDDIARIEDEKRSALDEFEKNTKADIISEIDERYQDKITNMESELDKKQTELDELDNLVKKQRIYISSNYEAYLGKEFMNVDKLTELNSIMKAGSADTIAQALSVYNNRH